MKHLLSLILISLIISSDVNANNHLEFSIDNNDISIGVDVNEESDFFIDLNYNIDKRTINYKVSDIVETIRIIDSNGKMIYQLPVYSKNVSLGKSLLEKGDYKLLFVVNNEVKETSTVVIK